jgi:hypothetical protein
LALTAAAGLVAWIALVDFNQWVPAGDLDGSWGQVLAYFLKNRFQAGADYIFSYGPLGYFASAVYDANLYWYKFAWELLIKLAFACTLIQLLRTYRSWFSRIMAYCLFVLSARLLLTLPDVHYLFFMLARLVLLIRTPAGTSRLARTVSVALLTLVALTKFTFFLFAVAALVLYARYEWRIGRRRQALRPLLGFALFFLFSWCALGQSSGNIPRFIYGSLQIASNYCEGMAAPGNRPELLLAVALFLILLLALIPFRRSSWQPASATATLLLGLGLFLQWKHSFVRQDMHAFGFFGLVFLTPFLLPAALPGYRWRSLPRAALLGCAMVLASFAMLRNLELHAYRFPGPLRKFPAQYWAANRKGIRNVLFPARQQAKLERRRAIVEAETDLPQIRAVVRDRPVDMISYEQGILLHQRLNLRPRPVFQSYSAYTPYLLRANADFFAGDKHPDYVIYKMQPLDDHLPTLEDGPALVQLLCRYQPVLMEKSFVLLQRISDNVTPPGSSSGSLREQVIHLNEEVSLDLPGERPQVISLRLRPTPLGILARLFYKPRLLYIRLMTDDGQFWTYRFIPGTAEAGFLINPLVTSNLEMVDLYGSRPERRVVSFRIVGKPGWRSGYRTDALMRLKAMPDIPRKLTAAPADPPNQTQPI